MFNSQRELLTFFMTCFNSDSDGQFVCTPCPKGYYCVENSTDYSHQVCPVGYYCPVSTRFAFEHPCKKGSYNPVAGSDAEVDCLSCPPGEYCERMSNYYRILPTTVVKNAQYLQV